MFRGQLGLKTRLGPKSSFENSRVDTTGPERLEAPSPNYGLPIREQEHARFEDQIASELDRRVD